jgi:hypothetical protein
MATTQPLPGHNLCVPALVAIHFLDRLFDFSDFVVGKGVFAPTASALQCFKR